MNNISFIDHKDSIFLDFPNKEHIFVENINSEKAKTCFLDYYDKNDTVLFTPKNIIHWSKINAISQKPLDNISLNDNFLFKGDNLMLLYSLKSVFQGTVKLIYIDPPYNTGNKFIYKDKFSRSIWLLFMKNRLEIAKEFLQNDGILVVQCDEKEHAYLKVLLDEIYDESNFLGSIIVQTNPSGRDYKSLARTHEYLLIYGKTKDAKLYPLILDKEFVFKDDFGGFELRSLKNGNIRFHIGNRPNLHYPFYVDIHHPDQYSHYPVSLEKKESFIEVYPKESQNIKTVWRWSKNKVLENITTSTLNSHIIARKSKDSFLIFEKYRKNTRLVRTIWLDKDFQTSKGTKHLKQMFDDAGFDYPKPELLIAKIIDISTKEGDRVMDFFLGSGTTAAVAQKARRKWIGIEQMPYIKTVTIPRIQKVLQGEIGGSSHHYNWKGGGEFIYGEFEPTEDFKFPFYRDLDKENRITHDFYKI